MMGEQTRTIERAVFEPIDEELSALRREGWRLVAAFRSSEFEVVLKLSRPRPVAGPVREAAGARVG
jgi:hypothetical protein